MSEYRVPLNDVETSLEIKKSRFITRLCHAKDRAQAMQLLEAAKRDYPDARHHCWAYLLGPPQQPMSVAMSDDGEPGGTAGKPILNVIQHKGVGDVMLIVIRYFGGIKLGAGGLVRAYSQAAQMAYDQLITCLHVDLDECSIECEFADEQSIRHWIALNKAEVRTVVYQHNVRLTVALDAQKHQDLMDFLAAFKKVNVFATGQE